MTKSIRPATDLNSFSCPHCSAVAHQDWYDLYEGAVENTKGFPFRVRADVEEIVKNKSDSEFPNKSERLKIWKRELADEVFSYNDRGSHWVREIKNLHISKCFSCKKSAVWIAHKLAWPETFFTILPNNDMPESVKIVFIEANKVVKNSPRAAAALLRLAIEELCNEINGGKDTIFNGIGKLVKNGLDPRIQKSLDIVRVTGNDAVHPGQLNLNDTPEDAERLFKLVNLIVENLITFPNEINEVYDNISTGKREAIERRDEIKNSK